MAEKKDALTLTFELEKETKNALRFKEKVASGTTPVCGTLYVQKSAAPDPAPKSVTVTITMS